MIVTPKTPPPLRPAPLPGTGTAGHAGSYAKGALFGSMGLVAVALATGCASPPTDVPPPLTPPETFSRSGADTLTDPWWTAFGNDDLNALVHLALQSNLTLRTAWFRLREAEAIAEREGAERFPALDAFARGSDERTDRDENDSDKERIELGFAASYEIDLWGRIQSSTDAERFRTEATRAAYQTAALSLSAEIAETWVRLMENRARLDLLDDQVEANEKRLRILENRFGQGQSRSVDVLRQNRLLEATRQERYATTSEGQVLEHQLAVLVGVPPHPPPAHETHPLPDLPSLPDTGLPMDLVERRPDVRNAYYALLAADRDTAEAVRARYPRLTLSASYATLEDGAETLFQNWILSLAGELAAPLLDAGRRAAEVRRAEAREQQLLYAYGQTILTAFRDVEDALVRETHQRTQLRSLAEQVRLAEAAYEQLREEYAHGVANFIDVLSAQTDAQQLRREYLSAKGDLLTFRIALYRALSGGIPTDME